MNYRKPHWRQDTPQMQIAALLGAIKGSAFNLVEGFGNRYEQEKRIERYADDIKEICDNYTSDSWD